MKRARGGEASKGETWENADDGGGEVTPWHTHTPYPHISVGWSKFWYSAFYPASYWYTPCDAIENGLRAQVRVTYMEEVDGVCGSCFSLDHSWLLAAV